MEKIKIKSLTKVCFAWIEELNETKLKLKTEN